MRKVKSHRSVRQRHDGEWYLEVIPEGFGFIRCENYMPGNTMCTCHRRRFADLTWRTGDIICGNIKVKTEKEKFSALLYKNSQRHAAV